MPQLELTFTSRQGSTRRPVDIRKLVIAGWTGRNQAQVEQHIEELAALGVARPASVPAFYELSPSLLTTGPAIQVVGDRSSGEAEAVIWVLEDGLWLGVGSDHTDRALEAVDVTWSKQVCAKPVSPQVWPLAEVESHWDALRLTSAANDAPYQAGDLAGLLPPQDLMARYNGLGRALPAGSVMFCGTLPLMTEIRFATGLHLALEDPTLGRRISHDYAAAALPHERVWDDPEQKP